MKIFIFVLLLSLLKNSFQQQECSVTIEQGRVFGSTRIDRNGGEFCSFTSIPYAKPPVGDLRFMPPESPTPWNGDLYATNEPPICYQISNAGATQGSEDCLYLNVYTKNIPIDSSNNYKLNPVMVFIHGGAFTGGSSRTDTFGPNFLLTEDIVLVTVNYRVNILGFLSLDDESLGVTGNAALKDQLEALKWVQKNIKYFGGNPHSVTLFGESAGAASVEFHTLSPSSQGLFHRAIQHSSSALNPWCNGIKGNGKLLAQQMNLQTQNDWEILGILKSLPVEQLYFPNDFQISYYRQNAPNVEGQIENAFLTENPRKLLKNGNFSRVPMIIGYNSDEGLYKMSEVPTYIDFTQYVPNDLNPNYDPQLKQTIANEIQNFYNSLDYNGDIFQMKVDVITDSDFLHGIYSSVKARIAASKSPLYFYRFSMSTSLNLVKNGNAVTAGRPGAAHADELFYLFKAYGTPTITPGSLEERGVEMMVRLWTNFAKYGNPTPKTAQGCLVGIEWPLVTSDSVIPYLEIGNTFNLEINPAAIRMNFWSNLYEKYFVP